MEAQTSLEARRPPSSIFALLRWGEVERVLGAPGDERRQPGRGGQEPGAALLRTLDRELHLGERARVEGTGHREGKAFKGEASRLSLTPTSCFLSPAPNRKEASLCSDGGSDEHGTGVTFQRDHSLSLSTFLSLSLSSPPRRPPAPVLPEALEVGRLCARVI